MTDAVRFCRGCDGDNLSCAYCGLSSTWEPGFRHCVEQKHGRWRCVDCGAWFTDWPSDDVACLGPDVELCLCCQAPVTAPNFYCDSCSSKSLVLGVENRNTK